MNTGSTSKSALHTSLSMTPYCTQQICNCCVEYSFSATRAKSYQLKEMARFAREAMAERTGQNNSVPDALHELGSYFVEKSLLDEINLPETTRWSA